MHDGGSDSLPARLGVKETIATLRKTQGEIKAVAYDLMLPFRQGRVDRTGDAWTQAADTFARLQDVRRLLDVKLAILQQQQDSEFNDSLRQCIGAAGGLDPDSDQEREELDRQGEVDEASVALLQRKAVRESRRTRAIHRSGVARGQEYGPSTALFAAAIAELDS